MVLYGPYIIYYVSTHGLIALNFYYIFFEIGFSMLACDLYRGKPIDQTKIRVV
jgi:hypothetical protein